MKKKTVLCLVLAFVVFMVGAVILYNNLSDGAAPDRLAAVQTPVPAQQETSEQPEATETPEIVPMPDFTVYDREGNEVHLTDFVGKPVIANFWASWCGPCKMEMPDFDAAWAEYGDDIHFLMINMTTSFQESYTAAATLIGQEGYSFPVYFDTDGSVAETYGISSLPTTLFLDAQGCGVTYAIGAIDAETLQRGIDILLSE